MTLEGKPFGATPAATRPPAPTAPLHWPRLHGTLEREGKRRRAFNFRNDYCHLRAPAGFPRRKGTRWQSCDPGIPPPRGAHQGSRAPWAGGHLPAPHPLPWLPHLELCSPPGWSISMATAPAQVVVTLATRSYRPTTQGGSTQPSCTPFPRSPHTHTPPPRSILLGMLGPPPSPCWTQGSSAGQGAHSSRLLSTHSVPRGHGGTWDRRGPALRRCSRGTGSGRCWPRTERRQAVVLGRGRCREEHRGTASPTQKPHLWEQTPPPSASLGHSVIHPGSTGRLLCVSPSQSNKEGRAHDKEDKSVNYRVS